MKKINVLASSYGYGKRLFEIEEENKHLKDNWNKLKEWLYRCARYKLSTNDFERYSAYKAVLEIMEEIEKGDSNEK